MCSHPGCRPSKSTFQFLKGPAGAPPAGGWALKNLPTSSTQLQESWKKMSQVATGPADAVYQVKTFLDANGISGDEIVEAIDEYAIQQWCSPDPWRCGAPRRHTPPDLPWATPMWERMNASLQTPDNDPSTLINGMVEELTGRINSPDGCTKCARRWNAWIALNRPDQVVTLEDARRWLWSAHNHTREGRPATPYFEIAQKFNWT